MAMNYEASVEIDRPVEEVFDYTTNNIAEWSLTVIKDEVVEEKPGGVGTTFRTTTEERGRQMTFDGVVTRHERPSVHAVRLVGSSFDLEADYAFEDLGGRTRVTLRSAVAPKGFFKVFTTLFGWLMNKAGCDAMEKEIQNLKRLAEERGGAAAS